MRKRCPNCGSHTTDVFYTVADVPTNSCLLVSSREEALRFPVGNIALTICHGCGFLYNAAFDERLTVYSALYEETQGFSQTFNVFHRELAEQLVQRHHLFEKDVLEIGCGKGEFLALLAELGRNRGVGYDPSFVPERAPAGGEQLQFVREFFSAKTRAPVTDFVCCKMTLEHVVATKQFVGAVRRVADADRGTVVFFQIPDARRIMEETAFWDVYYEHCSYFSPSSLSRVFRDNGFDVLRVWTGYDDQYLMIEARPSRAGQVAEVPDAERVEIDWLLSRAAGFAAAAERAKAAWMARIGAWASAGQKIVLWGSGSKAVSFLTGLRSADRIEFVVDINPFRQGKFIPRTAQQIVGPDFLRQYQPDVVIAMNPIYRDEIQRELERQECLAELLTVDDLVPFGAMTDGRTTARPGPLA